MGKRHHRGCCRRLWELLGYDKRGLNYGLLLDLPFSEGAGGFAYDRAKAGQIFTLHGPPTWTQIAPSDLTLLDFNDGVPDWLDCPAADTADLNFIAGDFSSAIWFKMETVRVTSAYLFCRGRGNTDGWEFIVSDTNNHIVFNTYSGAFNNRSTYGITDGVVLDTWYLAGMSRTGAVGTLYLNGVDNTATRGAHIDPVTSARELHIGIADNEASAPMGGKLWRPRIWNRVLSPSEWAQMFARERHLFGV